VQLRLDRPFSAWPPDCRASRPSDCRATTHPGHAPHSCLQLAEAGSATEGLRAHSDGPADAVSSPA
jgi:hypothetical protein